jgi:hypothetical protein
MAKAKVEKVELQDKQEKVSLDAKKIYSFESNGLCRYLPKGKHEVTGEMAELFTKQGYGKVC